MFRLKILQWILYAGAAACCLAGFWVIYVAIANFREMQYPQWVYVLVLEAIFVCLSFTPGLMLLMGLKTRTWHRVLMVVVEAIVLALALLAALVLIALTMPPPIG
ncbi:MAG: hypothetical protein ACRED1_05390 [Limisphaerales bacterium]